MSAASVILIAVGLLGVPQFASADHCGYKSTGQTRVNKTFKGQNSGQFTTVDAVEFGKYDVYTVSLSAGEHFVFVQSPADTDLQVCKGDTLVCASENAASAPDSCIVEGLEGNPGVGPSFTGAGQFSIHLRHCTHTKCGYPADAITPLAYSMSVITT